MSIGVTAGSKFGAWLVLKHLGRQKYQCLCTSCGLTYKSIRAHDLVRGKTRLCKSCSVKNTKATHGMSDTQEYNSWVHMIQRCHNPECKDYVNYGARGIEVCPLWRESFEAFYMAVGPKPAPDYTIERIDYNKNYEPGNCKWIPRAEQSLNKRDNVNITIGEETKTVSQWAQISPVNQFTIYKRLSRGWDGEEAVFAPIGTKKGEYKRDAKM